MNSIVGIFTGLLFLTCGYTFLLEKKSGTIIYVIIHLISSGVLSVVTHLQLGETMDIVCLVETLLLFISFTLGCLIVPRKKGKISLAVNSVFELTVIIALIIFAIEA